MIVNLTQHSPTPEQEKDGLSPTSERVRALLTISDNALMASDAVLDALLDGKVAALISEFVLPEQALRIASVAEGIVTKSVATVTDSLNAMRGALGILVLAQGADVLMERLKPALRRIGAVPVLSLSARQVVEITNPDGSVTKTSVFRHIRFRESAV